MDSAAVGAILTGFTVDIDHNPYLPTGSRRLSAVVTVTADASDTPPTGPGAAGDEMALDTRSTKTVRVPKRPQTERSAGR